MKKGALDSSSIGDRLRVARATAGLTQRDAAELLGVARTTIVAMERGARRVKAEELLRFAKVYGLSVNTLLRQATHPVDIVAQFRRSSSGLEKDSLLAVRLLHKLVSSYVDLEERLGATLRPNYPANRPLLRGAYQDQAKDLALNLRNRLGLGLGPIPDPVGLLESELGLRVFRRPLPSGVSEVFAYHPDWGACFLLNSNHREHRQAWSLAHGIGHLLTTREATEVCHWPPYAESRMAERFADLFAAAFLMPGAAIRRRFQDTSSAEGKFSIRHLILLAHDFYVSREAMARRLEQLGLLPKGTFDVLRERGALTDARSGEILAGREAERPVDRPSRFTVLAVEAQGRGLISEGQLADMLAVDRVEARAIVDSLGGENPLEWTQHE